MTLELIELAIRNIENKLNDPDLCKGTASTYSRVTGYYRATENWCNGKQAEYKQRLGYRVK